MLLAIPIGLVLGKLAGGTTDGLTAIRLRWAWIALAGLLVQVIVFTPVGETLAGDAVPVIYLGSTFAVFLAVVRNIRLPGMACVALGSLSNLAAIAANGGYMPADPGALALAGLPADDHLNSAVIANPALRPLTDIFAIPAGLPFANVFSVGDVVIAIGVVWVIVAAMRRRATPAPIAATA